MADWWMLGLIHGIVGYEALVLGFVGSGGSNAAEAMLIIAFLVYTVAVIMMALSKFGEVGGKAVDIAIIVMILVGGLFSIIGAGIWADQEGRNFNAYNVCLDLTGGLLAILSGIFFILKLVGVQEAELPDSDGSKFKAAFSGEGGGGGGGRGESSGRGRGRGGDHPGRGRGRGNKTEPA